MMRWLRLNALLALAVPSVFWTASPALPAAQFNITSGGQPTITGSLGGSVSGSSITTNPLAVTVALGELSPVNPNGMVRVDVPVIIRGTDAYQLSVSVTGGTNGDANAVQLSDIGFGIQNLHRLSGGRNCNNTLNTINSPFNNDPSVMVDRTGRAAYPSSLGNIGSSTVILFGPRLSTSGDLTKSDNGWAFDAILAFVPQFFSPGTFTLTLTFTIEASSCSCPC